MKIAKSTLKKVAGFAIALLPVFFWIRSYISSTSPEPSVTTTSKSELALSASNSQVNSNSQHDLLIQSFLNGRKSDPFWDWKRRIDFWGTVVDSDGVPIASANVEFEWNDMSHSGTSSSEALTDSDGQFELLNKIGKVLTISVSKPGYRRCNWGRVGFEYADPTDSTYHIPTRAQRVIFVLHKMGSPEPMIKRQRLEFRLPKHRKEIEIDLLAQMPVAGSDGAIDLRVFADSSVFVSSTGIVQSNWFVRIDSPQGAIQEGSDCASFAPESGYMPKLEYSGKLGDPDSVSGVLEKWIFLKSRQGKHFSRVWLDIAPVPKGGGSPVMRIHEYVLNPSGSRNLEFYPEMQVAEKYYVPREH